MSNVVSAKAPVAPFPVSIDSLDLEAQGVARHEGKVLFVRGALPGETVLARVLRRKPRFETAETVSVLRESTLRVEPPCPHFSVCGGCSMQHVEPRAQVSIKQRALEDALWHLARLRPELMLRPIVGAATGYRHRARLSVRHVPRKGGVLVGFHERGSSYVADMRQCEVLPPEVSALLVPLRGLVESLTIRDRLPQIEVAKGDTVLALVLRVLDSPSLEDAARLREFARRHQVELWLQPKGPDSIELFESNPPGVSGLSYGLPEFGLRMPFRPTDFTQVNPRINAVLVSTAVRLLELRPGDRVADFFCGLGNFTLPIATRVREVVGFEGSETLVARARANAAAAGLAASASFEAGNLFEWTSAQWQAKGHFDRVLIDPPREGALALSRILAAEEQAKLPRKLVYVSCNPATLARDAAILCHEGAWALKAAGVVNMFPHTSHVESIAVFEPRP